MRASSKGFTLVETVVSASILTIALVGTTKLLSQAKSSSAGNDLTSSLTFFEDLLRYRGTLVASNILFWMNQTTDGCLNAGYFLGVRVPPGYAPVGGVPGAVVPISPSYGIPLIEEDFVNSMKISVAGGADSGHKMGIFTSFAMPNAYISSEIATLKGWFDRYKAEFGTGAAGVPTWQLVDSCFQDQKLPKYPSEPSLLSYVDTSDSAAPFKSKDLTLDSSFRFCILLQSSDGPDAREQGQSGSVFKHELSPLIIARFDVTPMDFFTGMPVTCENKDLLNPQQFNINRGMSLTMSIGVIKNHQLAASKQVISLSARNFQVKKSTRMYINCHSCINKDDPAFRYECSEMFNVKKCIEN